MIKQLFKYTFITIIINSFCLSCTEPVGFDQINDFEISPAIVSSLVFLDEPAPRFLDNGNELTTIQDFVQVQFFNNGFIVENLVKAEFVFETTNSINRGFQIRVDFLDDSNQTQHTFTFSIPPSANTTNVASNHTELFEGDSLEALKSTTTIVFTLNMLPGLPINNDSKGRIILKSKSIFYFNIAKSIP
ncbi:hypothetical protein [Mariniflexile sp.]|uniref:hypothetical protein n=2 Tax=Mariniflexile sp. TaxID=1979402 RepID=UPI0040484853